MEESQGWERPRWFSLGKTIEVLPYDYYGSYGSKKNTNDEYADMVLKEYTFGFPEHHSIVSILGIEYRTD